MPPAEKTERPYVSREKTRAVAKIARKLYDPLPRKERDGREYGIHTGVLVVHAWNCLCHANLDLKMDDETMLEVMRKDFPDRECFQPVARMRSFFNHGRFGLGTKGVRRAPEDRLVHYAAGE